MKTLAAGACLLTLAACPAGAHVVSMSSGEMTIQGTRGRFELRMPLYEITHVAEPERTLLEHIRFSSGGRAANLVTKTCTSDTARDQYLCTAEYEFAAPVETLEVNCTLTSITVPNHVHLLRASMDGKHDQALFDRSFTKATLRFRLATETETAMAEAGAGFLRALGGPTQILFLAALALAARTRKELGLLLGMFLLGQAAAVLVVPRTTWQPAARFVEAAAALTVAYLAVEILLLPKAGARWLVAGVLGAFHGLYFHLFVQTSGYSPGWVLAGAALAEVTVAALLAVVFSRIERVARAMRPVQIGASALFVFGMVWFVLRLRS